MPASPAQGWRKSLRIIKVPVLTRRTFINSMWLKSSLSPRCWAQYHLACPPCLSTGALVPPPPAWKSLDPTASGGDTRGCVLGSRHVPINWLFGRGSAQRLLHPLWKNQSPQHPRLDFSSLPGKSRMGRLDPRRAGAGLGGRLPKTHPLVRVPLLRAVLPKPRLT